MHRCITLRCMAMQHLAIVAARIETSSGALTVPLRAFVGDSAGEAERLAKDYATTRGDMLAWFSDADLISSPERGQVQGLGSFRNALASIGVHSVHMVVTGTVAHSSGIETVPAGVIRI